MRNFEVKYSETFYRDLNAIVSHIFEQSGSRTIARNFYRNVLSAIDRRSFGADSYEKFQPYEGSPDYYRIYYGHYTVFYVIEDNSMDVRRILWSGMDLEKRL